MRNNRSPFLLQKHTHTERERTEREQREKESIETISFFFSLFFPKAKEKGKLGEKKKNKRKKEVR